MASLSTKTGRSSFAVMHWKTPSWQNTTFHFCDLWPAESGSGLFMPCSRRKKVELWNTQKQKLENHVARMNANLFWTQKSIFFHRYLFCQCFPNKTRMNTDVLRVFDLSVTHFIFWAPPLSGWLVGQQTFQKKKRWTGMVTPVPVHWIIGILKINHYY